MSFPDLIEKYIREKQESKKVELCVASWLDSASKRASQLFLATHVIKYTHSDAKGTSVDARLKSVNANASPYVMTESLSKIKDDITGNGAVMDVAAFLQLEMEGRTLLDLISNNDSAPLAPFADSETRLQAWMDGFKTVLVDPLLSSNTLAKQVYFPVEGDQYHLLAPLFATSVSHTIYENIQEDRYGEEAKANRKCKREKAHSDGSVTDYHGLAIQTFGGSKPHNISLLNSLRGGKAFLLRSAPPHWRVIKKPPLKKLGFWNEYGRRVFPLLKDFQQFILKIQDQASNKNLRDKRAGYVGHLLDLLLQVAAEVQSMKSGWSALSEISVSEQIWLDPLREEFIQLQQDEEWMRSISGHFAKWITDKLKYKNKNLHFSDEDYDHLKSECFNELKAVS